MNRFDMYPHLEDCMTMTCRELMFHLGEIHRHKTSYCGRGVLKFPTDWLVMAEILEDTRPPLIVEIGSFDGGFALWMAHTTEALGLDCSIIGIDIKERPSSVKHPRIEWVIGDATSPEVLAKVTDVAGGRKGMVIEDSDHKYATTKRLLDLYENFVAPNCYLVVEDTVVEYLAIPPIPGPLRAAQEFVQARDGAWVTDRSREKYIVTCNPSGYLLRL